MLCEQLVLRDRDTFDFHRPLMPADDTVQSPVDEHPKLGFVPPLHATLVIRRRSGLRRRLGGVPFLCDGQWRSCRKSCARRHHLQVIPSRCSPIHLRASQECIGTDLGPNSMKGGFYSGVSSSKSGSACGTMSCEQRIRLGCDRFPCLVFCIRNAWYSTRPMHSDQNQNAAVARGLLKENVAQRLREEILAARISPGEKIVEGKWAREYGVAQISVREALNILATQGFVTKGHGRSARVLKLERADIIHIYQVRGVLEGLAARVITEDKLPVDDLEAGFNEIQRSVGTGDLRQVIESVQRFHMLMLEKPRNSVLREHGRRLLVPLYAFTLMKALVKRLDVGPWERQLRLHRLIIDVLQQGNPHLAEETLIHVTDLFLHAALEVWAP